MPPQKGRGIAKLMYANSYKDSDMFYATQFMVGDPVVFLEVHGKKILFLSDLEIERGKNEAQVDRICNIKNYEELAKKNGTKNPDIADIIDEILKEMKIKSVVVPENFYDSIGFKLRSMGYELVSRKGTFFEERLIKTDKEIEKIAWVSMINEKAMDAAISIIRRSAINDKDGYLYYIGQKLTSEYVKNVIKRTLLDNDCLAASGSIVSCGDQACEPHNSGSGPLKANEFIVIDIFPFSEKTRYCADMTRTVIRGKASAEQKKLYETVLDAQEKAIKMIRHGVLYRDIHEHVVEFFKKEGYRSGEINGKVQGFFHGIGHGLGLDIHEEPRCREGNLLEPGNVITIEPGLYYYGLGGVRIEDLLVVTKNGYRNLNKFPKAFLEI